MILGVTGIIAGHSLAYSTFAGDRTLGGGFHSGDAESELKGDWWKFADRFQIYRWDTSGDRVVRRTPKE